MKQNITIDGDRFAALAREIRARGDERMIAILDNCEAWGERWNCDFREMPERGEVMLVRTTITARYMPYKPNSNAFRDGKKGRWQYHDGRSWIVTERPVGDWLSIADSEADKHGRSRDLPASLEE